MALPVIPAQFNNAGTGKVVVATEETRLGVISGTSGREYVRCAIGTTGSRWVTKGTPESDESMTNTPFTGLRS